MVQNYSDATLRTANGDRPDLKPSLIDRPCQALVLKLLL
jgi:hypothetical protein